MPCLLLALAVSAAAPPPPEARFVARVTELVRQLGDDDFDRRQAAQEALVAFGPPAIAVLDTLPAPTDPEVVQRLREVRKRIAAQPVGRVGGHS